MQNLEELEEDLASANDAELRLKEEFATACEAAAPEIERLNAGFAALLPHRAALDAPLTIGAKTINFHDMRLVPYSPPPRVLVTQEGTPENRRLHELQVEWAEVQAPLLAIQERQRRVAFLRQQLAIWIPGAKQKRLAIEARHALVAEITA